jgi:hypothetical protein
LSRIFIKMETRCEKTNLLKVIKKTERLGYKEKPLLGILTNINSSKGMNVHFVIGDKNYLGAIKEKINGSNSLGYLEMELKDTIN